MNQEKGFICPVCGKRDYVPSTVTIRANYGSGNDGDSMTLYLCGDCVDRCMEYAWGIIARRVSDLNLTDRQAAILKLRIQRKGADEIAAHLNISDDSARTAAQRINARVFLNI